MFPWVFSSGIDAINYVAAQKGIFGSPQRIELNKYGYYAYASGYSILEVEVERYNPEEYNKEVRRNALTKEEKKALGL